jgi:hypothetical protein
VSMSLLTAVRGLLADVHLDPPVEWESSAQTAQRADAVVEQLVTDGKLSRLQGDWLLGHLPPDEARQHKLPHELDQRAVFAAWTVNQPRHAQSVSVGYRSQASKRQLGRYDKPEVAADLTVRPYRHLLTAPQRDSVMSVMSRTLRLAEVRDPSADGWSASGRDPDALLHTAIAELGRDGTRPATVELAVAGLYHLARTQTFRRDTRNSPDNRSNEAVLRAMMQTEHGLRQLHRAVVDGRADRDIVAVDPDGSDRVTATGQVRTLVGSSGDAWIRETFPADGAAPGRDGRRGTTRSAAAPPEKQLHEATETLRAKVEQVTNAAVQIRRIVKNGDVLVDTAGLSPTLVDELRQEMRTIDDDLAVWARTYRNRHGGEPWGAADERDDDES